MIQSICCPNCSGPLDYDGSREVLKCAYCGASVVVAQLTPSAPKPDPQIPDPSLTEVAALMHAGKRVQATILYREITGAGLKRHNRPWIGLWLGKRSGGLTASPQHK